MKIININNINFNARPVAVKKTKAPMLADDKDIYNDINDFLNKNCDKIEYLNRFSKKFELPKSGDLYSQAEKNYINDLLLTLDLSDDWRKISDKALRNSMEELLKTR